MRSLVIERRYIFTVTAGRSGQSSLAELLGNYVPTCLPAFEEPQIEYRLPPVLQTLERNVRRRFVETHELLGRGKVLTAFVAGDDAYIDRIARRRLAAIDRELLRQGKSIYFDISKFFSRGLHGGFARGLESIDLVRLVRDPVRNMRSFLNRNKRFSLDNNAPDAAVNEFRVLPSDFHTGEFYLWAWCEMYLRFERIAERYPVRRAVEIRTEQLIDPIAMIRAFNKLELPHLQVASRPPLNTNQSQGLPATRVSRADIELFERFLFRIPSDIRARIAYFADYDPWVANARYLAETS